ncbi:AAA family ATPase [Vibrio splendidus]|nr:AAA family ATPase [Vibrio splendidus]MCC4881490.1 AAA family ATPase [Vibrio splendidus]
MKLKLLGYLHKNDSDTFVSARFLPVDEESRKIVRETIPTASDTGAFVAKGRAFFKPTVDDIVVMRGTMGSDPNATDNEKEFFNINSLFPAHFLERSAPEFYEVIRSCIVPSIPLEVAYEMEQTHGRVAVEIFKEDPDRIVELGYDLPMWAVKRDWLRVRKSAHDIEFMRQMGFDYEEIGKVMAYFGEHPHLALDTISRNPYQLMNHFSVAKIDEYAKRVYWDEESIERLGGVIDYFYKDAASRGSCAIGFNQLFKSIEDEGVKVNHVSKHILKHSLSGAYTLGNEVLQSVNHNRWELEAANATADYLCSFDLEDLSHIEPDEDYLTPEQREAVKGCVSKKFSILTGGPGRGKTTVIKAIMGIIGKSNSNAKIIGLAPTGQAAKRMSESIGQPCFTIHETIKYNESTGFSGKKKKYLDADVVIVDEMSMTDLYTYSRLIQSIKPGTRLIIVGDKDQLPSVEVGNILSDLIAIDEINVNYLTQPIRFGDFSELNENAIAINEGRMPDLKANRYGNWHFIETENDEQTKDRIISLCTNFIPGELGVTHSQIQILSPQYKSVIGVDYLNEKLKRVFNPQKPNSFNPTICGKEFAIGDRIVINKTIKDMGIPNGSVGILKYIDYKKKTINMEIDGQVRYLPMSTGRSMELCYSKTIHKSQGTESEAIIIPVSMTNKRSLQKALLYTAVTRAKKHVFLVGDKKAIEYCINHDEKDSRLTFLKEKIRSRIEQNRSKQKTVTKNNENHVSR